MQRPMLCLVTILTLASFSAAQDAADPWAPLNLQPVPFEGGTLLIEPALMDQREALLERVDRLMRKVADAKAAREAAAAEAPRVIAAIHRITGLEADRDASQAMFTDIAENATVVPAPAERFRVYAVQSETIKAFLRSGNQLPDFTYDPKQDRATYKSSAASRNQSIVLDSITLLLAPDGSNVLQALEELFLKLPSLEGAVHEVAELAVFRRLGDTNGAHFRWLSDGLANVITEQVLREVYGEDKALAFRSHFDPAKYAEIKSQVNLRYWLSVDFDPQASTPIEERLTHARYAHSYALMRQLLADEPSGTVSAILAKAAEHERTTPVHLTQAIAAITGKDVNHQLDTYQTFTTTADGVAKYEQQLLTARDEGGDEAALSVIIRLLELRSETTYSSEFYRLIAVHLRRMGDAAAGAKLLRRQVHTAGNHLTPEAQHMNGKKGSGVFDWGKNKEKGVGSL